MHAYVYLLVAHQSVPVAHNWRAPANLQLVWSCSRLCEPAASTVTV